LFRGAQEIFRELKTLRFRELILRRCALAVSYIRRIHVFAHTPAVVILVGRAFSCGGHVGPSAYIPHRTDRNQAAAMFFCNAENILKCLRYIPHCIAHFIGADRPSRSASAVPVVALEVVTQVVSASSALHASTAISLLIGWFMSCLIGTCRLRGGHLSNELDHRGNVLCLIEEMTGVNSEFRCGFPYTARLNDSLAPSIGVAVPAS
jgi:hypothetical protein